MSDLNAELDQVAGELEKSTRSPKEILFVTIRELGPEGIKAKLPTLEKSEQNLLISALQEMKKAVEMDKDYAAKFVQGNIEDTKIQEDKADDDQDEKLVKPDAAKFDHQGTPTPGWEGQVIKAKMDRENAKEKIMQMEEKEHGVKDPKKLVEAEKEEHEKKSMKKSIDILKQFGQDMLAMFPEDFEKAHVGFEAVSREAAKHGADDPDAVAAAVGRKKYGKQKFQQMAAAGKKKEVKKGEDMDKCGEGMYKKQGVPKGVDPDKQERCVRKLKGEPGKNPYAICNASMKKGAPVTAEVKEALLEIRKSVEEQLKEFGKEPTAELVKAEMKRLLAEESQDGDAPEMNEKTRAKKENVEALNLASDNKAAQKKVDDEKQGQGGAMKKAVWGGEQDLIKALTGGRNYHFSLETYIQEVLAENTKPAQTLEKSEKSNKEDLNDIIAKGGDADWDHVNTDRLLKANKAKVNGKVVKSFSDNEIAQALGLTEEEAKKILGE